MHNSEFWRGETVRVRVAFVDLDGLPVVATGVVIQTKDPAGTLASATVVAGTVGVFYGDVPVTLAGEWRVRSTCTGPSPAAIESKFKVLASMVIA